MYIYSCWMKLGTLHMRIRLWNAWTSEVSQLYCRDTHFNLHFLVSNHTFLFQWYLDALPTQMLVITHSQMNLYLCGSAVHVRHHTFSMTSWELRDIINMGVILLMNNSESTNHVSVSYNTSQWWIGIDLYNHAHCHSLFIQQFASSFFYKNHSCEI